SKEDHEVHLKFVLDLLKKEKLFAKLLSVSFGCKKFISSGMIGMRARAKRQGKANDCSWRFPQKDPLVLVVADALGRKEIVKLRQMRAMSMTIQSSIKDKLLVSQYEVSKEEKAPIEMLCGLD
ncbi:hypothetical protein Tco_1342339, partial [Tanacetum coccineum]